LIAGPKFVLKKTMMPQNRILKFIIPIYSGRKSCRKRIIITARRSLTNKVPKGRPMKAQGEALGIHAIK
jgi:hypothetical protein